VELAAQIECDSLAPARLRVDAAEDARKFDRPRELPDRELAGEEHRAAGAEADIPRGEHELGIPLDVEEVGGSEAFVPLGAIRLEARRPDRSRDRRRLTRCDHPIEIAEATDDGPDEQMPDAEPHHRVSAIDAPPPGGEQLLQACWCGHSVLLSGRVGGSGNVRSGSRLATAASLPRIAPSLDGAGKRRPWPRAASS